MDKHEEALKKRHCNTPIPTDNECVTTSIESDIFETWTLVKDENNKKSETTEMTAPTITTTERIEILNKEDNFAAIEDGDELEQLEQQYGSSKPEADSSVDEFSDGISIISETESGGRMSPLPQFRDLISNLNLKFGTGDPDLMHRSSPELFALNDNSFEEASSDSQLRQRRQKRDRSRSTSTSDSISNVLPDSALDAPDTDVPVYMQLPPLLRYTLNGLFYISIAMIVVGFISKLRYSDWKSIGANKPIVELEQKMIDIELQNNLMRAEIDLLSKQVTYLNNLNERKVGSDKAPYKVLTRMGREEVPYKKSDMPNDTHLKGKMFKAWLGNGKLLEPIAVTKGDLKRPYRCNDGDFVEVAGMCVENRPKEKSLMDNVGEAVNDVLQQNEAFQVFEQVAEKLQNFNKIPFEDEEYVEIPPLADTPALKPTYMQQDLPKQPRKEQVRNGQEFKHSGERYEGSGHSKVRMQQQRFREQKDDFNDDYRERYEGSDHSKERIQQQRFREQNGDFDDDSHQRYEGSDHSKERMQQQRFREQNGDFDDDSRQRYEGSDHSKERMQQQRFREQNGNFDDDSHERNTKRTYNSKESGYNKKKSDNSKERYATEKHQRKSHHHHHSGERDNKDGHWHEKRMQHRADTRRQNDQHNGKNWYIKRGDGREQLRHDDSREQPRYAGGRERR